MNSPRNATCRLCHTRSELRESHIFPRSLIKLVRDGSTNKFYAMHDRADDVIQDGPKEHLLCDECEEKISRYEKYFKEAIHLSRHGIEVVQTSELVIIRNLDYSRVKLFLLSIIWRMSVSSLPQFEHVSLGENEDVVRGMIIEEAPGDSQTFPVCATIPLVNGRMEEGILCTPFVSEHKDVYAFIIGGVLYFVSTKQGSAFPFPLCLLHESGSWVMPLLDFEKVPFLNAFLTRHFGSDSSPEGAAD